ncbi:basic membrane lipoprotein [Gemmatirosa kalamazoonensis]|uniref:Basic membrane lipoprotein n=1 Tax=Gemmatirosa kalamazoonensis TaxID=861299 RepID=W0REG5_9BACT|nr:BMP family protein [Gemmatirosa kalamazoonensis]AHG88705.1 basic membrane lipoprotein [Gemmatirosa kalamazoonensis]
MAVWASVAACGRGERSSSGGTAAADSGSSAFRVALLTPGPITDQSWNAGAYNGLKAIRDSLGARISHIQTKTPAEFEENFRQYGAQGYQLVIGHGFEFQEAALRVAPSYPKTVYVTTSGNSTAANVAGLTFGFEDASYLAGLVAGAMTKSNTIGMIGGTELPPVKASFAAFTAAAKTVNPKVAVLSSFIGNWDDVSAGKEQALAQIGRGADVIFQNADAAGLGVFQAAKERAGGGVYVVGSNSNQNAVAPDVTLGSVVIDLPHALLLVAREVKDGSFRPRVITLGMREDVVTWVPNPTLASRVPAAVQARVDSVRRLMMSGAFSAEGK